jgi:hypothetical protein
MSMLNRLLPLALLALWAPAALAFPPCPQEPVDIDPVLDGTPGDPLYQVWFSTAGDKALLERIMPQPPDSLTASFALPVWPGSGNCKTGASSVELPGPNATSPTLGETPPYAPRSALGLLALPDLRLAQVGTHLTYRYDVAIANRILPAPGDWADVLQIEFRRNSASKDNPALSTYYRLRLRQNTQRGLPVVEVIEVRLASDEKSEPVETLVAMIPLDAEALTTPISLRWHQAVRGPEAGDSGGGDKLDGGTGSESVFVADGLGFDPVIGTEVTLTNLVDSSFEILGPNHAVLYHATLQDQWADALSTGVLNYHSPSIAADTLTQAAYLRDEFLRIEE